MDADGDHKASPYNSVDAVFSSARYLRASGAPRSYRRALYAYNHSWSYVRTVLARARLFACTAACFAWSSWDLSVLRSAVSARRYSITGSA